jgi:putative endonuclease
MGEEIFVYAIYISVFDRIYIGMTNNLDRRMKEHTEGGNQSTKAFIPWAIIFFEVYSDRKSARVREKYLKSYRGRGFVRSKIDM